MSIKINCRLDIKTVAHIKSYIEYKLGTPVTSASSIIKIGTDFLSQKIEENGFPRPTTIDDSLRVLGSVLTKNMKTKQLSVELGKENFNLESGSIGNIINFDGNVSNPLSPQSVKNVYDELQKTLSGETDNNEGIGNAGMGFDPAGRE